VPWCIIFFMNLLGKRITHHGILIEGMDINFKRSIGEDDEAREKRKARELRHSAWWRRKVSVGICYYCGGKFPPHKLTMDHKIPLARGGKSEKINIVVSCKECNTRKKNLLPVEWDEYMQRIRSDRSDR
jgi:5-methylcytosine-specific restriction protein A